MTGIAAVVARELQEWRRVFVAALAAGFLGVVAVVVVSRTFRASDPGVPGALAVFAMMGFGVAILAGAGLIGRDLVERRMSFYFYRPLSEASIWAGKILAAIFLAVLSGVLVLVPGILIGRGLLDVVRFREGQLGGAILMGATVCLVIVSNSFYLALRALSKWVLLDLAALAVSIGLLAVALMPLEQARADSLVIVLGMIFGAVFLLALLLGGYAGLKWGRIDLREVHKFHAWTAWPMVGIALIALLAYPLWVRSADGEDLNDPGIMAIAAEGPWIGVSGQSEGRYDYVSNLLVDVESGRTLPIAGGSMPRATLTLSEDGRRAVWFEPLPLDPTRGELAIGHPERLGKGRLVFAELDRKPRIEETTIVARAYQTALALSADGSRLALLSDDLLTIIDLNSDRVLASARIPRPKAELPKYYRRPSLYFANPQVVHLYRRASDAVLEIYQFDLGSRRLERTGVVDAGEDFAFRISSAGTLGLRRWRSEVVELRDARTGQLKTTVLTGKDAEAWDGFLSDGRLVVFHAPDGRALLEIYSSSGAPEKSIDLGPAKGVRVGAEVEPGKLVVATSPIDPRSWEEFKANLALQLVDLSSGEVKPLGRKLIPVSSIWVSSSEGPKPGTAGTKLFARQGQLIYFDPKSGEERVIAGRKDQGGAP